MSDIRLYEGWHQDRRFKALRREYGRQGLGDYLLLQAYFQQYSHDTWMVDVGKEMKFICFDLDLTEEEVKKIVESVISSGLGHFVKESSVLFLEKAGNHVLNSSARDDRAGIHHTVTDRARTDDHDHDHQINLNVLPSSGGEGGERTTPLTPPQEGKTNHDDHVEGLRITLHELTDGLSVESAKGGLEGWMKHEAARAGITRKLDFNSMTRPMISRELANYGERFFMGAWKIFVWDAIYANLNDVLRTPTPVSLFLKKNIIGEKVEVYLKTTGEELPRRYVDLVPGKKQPKKKEAKTVEDSKPARSENAEPVHDECLAAQAVRRLAEDKTAEMFTPEKEGDGKV